MPHPKHRMKQTGDTHPPEVEWDLDGMGTDEFSVPPDTQPGRRGSRRAPMRSIRPAEAPPAHAPRRFRLDTVDQAREQVRARPLAMLGYAFAAGFLIGKLFR